MTSTLRHFYNTMALLNLGYCMVLAWKMQAYEVLGSLFSLACFVILALLSAHLQARSANKLLVTYEQVMEAFEKKEVIR